MGVFPQKPIGNESQIVTNEVSAFQHQLSIVETTYFYPRSRFKKTGRKPGENRGHILNYELLLNESNGRINAHICSYFNNLVRPINS